MTAIRGIPLTLSNLESIEHLRALRLSSRQNLRIQTECCQDRRCNLLCADHLRELFLLKHWVANEAGDMSVVYANAAVFGDFGSRVGRSVNDTELGPYDDIRNGGISFGVTEALRYEALSKYDIVNLQCVLLFVEVLDRS
jgi:hypothetical protein